MTIHKNTHSSTHVECWLTQLLECAHIHTHTEESYLPVSLQAVGVWGSVRRDWYLCCLWSAAAHQFRLQWDRRSSWPNPIPLLCLPVIASVCLLIAYVIFKDPDHGLPSIHSEAAAAAAVWWPASVQADTKLDRNSRESPPPLSLSLCVSCLCFCLQNFNQGPSLNWR